MRHRWRRRRRGREVGVDGHVAVVRAVVLRVAVRGGGVGGGRRPPAEPVVRRNVVLVPGGDWRAGGGHHRRRTAAGGSRRHVTGVTDAQLLERDVGRGFLLQDDVYWWRYAVAASAGWGWRRGALGDLHLATARSSRRLGTTASGLLLLLLLLRLLAVFGAPVLEPHLKHGNADGCA